MAAQKKVDVKVMTDVEDGEVEALETKVNRLKNQRIHAKIEADTAELENVNSRITEVKKELASLQGKADVDDGEVQALKQELKTLEGKALNLEIAVEKGNLDAAKAEIEEMDGMEINVDANMSMQNISQGIAQAKQGIEELKQNMDEVAAAGMQSEQNKAFLSMNLGAEKARDTYQQISDIVKSMPGDDNTMRSVLSTAQALGNNLNADEMKAAAATMADYMSGSATMGKMALESQQDIMKYLLDGNTAELERGSIVSSQVDKLKEATTFQERQAAMQQVLNELGYGGISQQDTMLNKQAEWEGMIYNSQDALSSMWLGAEKGAMDYILKLNDATNGILGMGIVAGQMVAGPLVETMSGVGQIAMGMKGLKEIYAMLIPTQIAEGAAGWFSIGWIAVAIIAGLALGAAIWYLYENCDWFREGLNNLGATLQWVVGVIYDSVLGTFDYMSTVFQNFTEQLGLNTNDWTQAVLGFILFIPQLPLQLGIVLTNAIMKTLGFGDNFVQSIGNSALNAYNAFKNGIAALSDSLKEELDDMLDKAWDFAAKIPHPLAQAATAMHNAWQDNSGEHSPGFMYNDFTGELSAMENRALQTKNVLPSIMGDTGKQIGSSFNNTGLNTVNSNLLGASSSSNGDIIINVYGDIDNDKRIRELVDAVKRDLNWDNTTAGRTI